jgi:Ca-activated chloride channel family protein
MSQNIKNSILVFSLIFMIIAIARPVMNKKEHKIKEELIPIIVAIDVSKSMLASDIYPNRLELAKQKLLKILQTSKNSAIGVVLFAKSSFVLSPVTQDFTSLTFLVKNLDKGLNFDNGSNILSTLEASNDLLEDYNSKNIIILSDGGNKDNYKKEIDFANENNIKVYTIGTATNKPTPIPSKDGYLTSSDGKIVTVQLNKNISSLSLKTGGGYIDFSLNDNDISAIVNDIYSQAKKEFMNSTKIKTYTELFYYPLGLSILLLFLSFSSFSSNKNRSVVVLLLLSSLFTQNSHADILDFKTLKEAKESYNKKEFNKSEELYKKANKNEQASYNLANSLYNQKKYKEAQEIYKNIKTQDKNLQYKSLHNLGNSYVKQNKLEEAKKSYENALKINNDEQTKQNLETVNKALKQKKKQDKNKDSKKNNKDKKNKNENKDKQGNKKNKDKQDKKKEQKGKDSQKDKNKQQDKKNKNDQKSSSEKNKDSSKQNKSKKQKVQKQISDMEEKKWLNQLKNQKSKTFLRKYDSKNQDDNIKNPW